MEFFPEIVSGGDTFILIGYFVSLLSNFSVSVEETKIVTIC